LLNELVEVSIEEQNSGPHADVWDLSSLAQVIKLAGLDPELRSRFFFW
jgi:hypothetical protein